jgi:hypothetical protein
VDVERLSYNKLGGAKHYAGARIEEAMCKDDHIVEEAISTVGALNRNCKFISLSRFTFILIVK